jgi:hypothetical protein
MNAFRSAAATAGIVIGDATFADIQEASVGDGGIFRLHYHMQLYRLSARKQLPLRERRLPSH